MHISIAKMRMGTPMARAANFVHLLLEIDTSLYSILHFYSLLFSLSPQSTSQLYLPLPITHMRQNNLRCILRTMLPPNRLDEIPLRIHQIKINTVVDQIILALLDTFRRAKVHSILLADVFYLFPRSCQADYGGVEFGEVGLEDAGRVSCWVAGYEEWEERRERGGGLRGEEW
jgi:hypothetical protein